MSVIHDLSANDTCGQPNIPGFKVPVYIVCSHDIDVWPTLPDYDPQAPETSVTMSADIVLKPNKKWAKFEVVSGTGLLKSIAQGNLGSKGYRNEFSTSIAGSDPATLSFWNRLLNGCFVAIVEEKNGRKRLIGSKDDPAHYDTIEVENSSEKNEGVGLMYDTCGYIAPIYTGDIDLDDLT